MPFKDSFGQWQIASAWPLDHVPELVILQSGGEPSVQGNFSLRKKSWAAGKDEEKSAVGARVGQPRW